MKKALRYTALGLLVAAGAAQFFQPARNLGEAEGPQSLVRTQKVPADIQKILQRSCYDCHSNHTNYPWYASVQPVGWWLRQHVNEGKEELNFSEFAAYDTKRAVRRLQSAADEVRERHMPLSSYLLVHREARLSDAEVTRLQVWAEDLADELESR
jgi:hypothetical protein